MALPLATSVAMAFVVNFLVCIYFYAMYKKQNGHCSYLHWSRSCGLFAGGILLSVVAHQFQDTQALNAISCFLLYASTYGLFFGLNLFELARHSSHLFQRAQILFFAGAGAILITSFHGQLVNAVASAFMAIMFFVTEGYFHHRKSPYQTAYNAMRAVLLLHAFIMFLQAAVIFAMTFSGHDSATNQLFEAALLSHLILVIATALLLPVLHLLRQRRYWQKKADTDELTNLLSRRAFIQKAYRSLANRNISGHSLLMVDIDHFKKINDKHGHPMGDKLLRQVAKAMTKVIRNSDIIGRLGGEEFVILMPEATSAEALRVAERLREAVAKVQIDFQRESITTTVSIGISASSELLDTWDLLLENADQALYTAKRQGRNMVCKFDSPQPYLGA